MTLRSFLVIDLFQDFFRISAQNFVILSLKNSDDLFLVIHPFSRISALKYYNIIQIIPISYCFYTLYPLYSLHTYIKFYVSTPYSLLS